MRSEASIAQTSTGTAAHIQTIEGLDAQLNAQESGLCGERQLTVPSIALAFRNRIRTIRIQVVVAGSRIVWLHIALHVDFRSSASSICETHAPAVSVTLTESRQWPLPSPIVRSDNA